MRQAATAALPQAERAQAIHWVQLLSWATLAWLTVDGAIGMAAGLASNSIALIGWGLDSAIQALAASVVLWRFTGSRVHSDHAERLAQRVVAVTFFLLAPYVLVASVIHLVTGNAASTSWVGIGLAATDAALMPLLGTAKRNAGHRLGSPATANDGRQNLLCAYLSLAVLLGLATNALLGWWQADPLVAILVATVVVQAGVTSWRGARC